MVHLSVLDFGMVAPPFYTSKDALPDMLDLLIKAEALGYKRYWLAEHFTKDCAWAFPEMLLPLMAGMTSRIKIGLAGVLLNYHIPYQVASNFKLLSYLYPQRIDLGIARGGVPPEVQKALRVDNVTDNLYAAEQMGQLYDMLVRADTPGNRYQNLALPPDSTEMPDIWQLCSSLGQGVEFAQKYKSNLCLSLIHQSSEKVKCREAIAVFKDFLQSENRSNEIATAINVFCNNDREILRKKQKQIENGPFGTNLVIGNDAEVKE